jgi:putative Holliday junction resolvase
MEKVLGLDLGSRSCGIAISDSLGIAHGREEFRFLDGAYKQCLKHILEYANNEKVKTIALGYPLNMDGSAGESAQRSERFKDELLAEDPTLKVVLVDERLTTVMATHQLLEADLSRAKRHKVIDQQSAVIILESYLNTLQGGSGYDGD